MNSRRRIIQELIKRRSIIDNKVIIDNEIHNDEKDEEEKPPREVYKSIIKLINSKGADKQKNRKKIIDKLKEYYEHNFFIFDEDDDIF